MENSQLLLRVLEIWTGYGNESCPDENEKDVFSEFGDLRARDLLAKAIALKETFYESDAFQKAADLSEMQIMAQDDFRQKYPELDVRISIILSWCYTYDHK